MATNLSAQTKPDTPPVPLFNWRSFAQPLTRAARRQPPVGPAAHAKVAKAILLPGESKADLARVISQLVGRFDPRDRGRSHARSAHARRSVADYPHLDFERLALYVAPEDDSEGPNMRSLDIFLDLQTKSRAGNVFQTFIQRYKRQFDKAVAQLEHLRGNLNFRRGNPTSDCRQTETVENGQPKAVPQDATFALI